MMPDHSCFFFFVNSPVTVESSRITKEGFYIIPGVRRVSMGRNNRVHMKHCARHTQKKQGSVDAILYRAGRPGGVSVCPRAWYRSVL